MQLNVTAIIIIIALLIIIAIMLVYIFRFRGEITTCQSTESPYCLVIGCPCNTASAGPCFGYAQRNGPTTGTFYCSNAPLTLVNSSGAAVTA